MTRYGKGVTLALFGGAMVLTVSMGVRQSFGLFMGPMTAALAMPGETFALAIAVQNLLWGLTQPLAGMVADRFGSGRVLAGGALLYAVGLVVMAGTGSAAGLQLGAGLLVGLGISATSFAVVLGAVGRLVPAERRSMALGLVSAGGSLGQFLIVPLGQAAIDALGWMAALLLLAVLALAMGPLAALVGGRPEAKRPESSQTLGAAVAEASRHSGFWLLTAGFFVCGFHVAFIATHLVVFAVSCGLSAMTGATALSLIGLFNIGGTYAAGWAGGRWRKKKLLAGIYLARGAAILALLALPKTATTLLVFSAAIGALWLGTVPLTSGLVAQIFGPRYVATLFGIVFLGHQVGAFFGAWLGGYVYDRAGNYDAVWIVSVMLALLAAALHWPIADRPVPRARAEAAAGAG